MKSLRDISVAFIKSLGKKGATLLDSTSATGIRGIRYAKEAGTRSFFIDVNERAAKNSLKNVKRNMIKAKVINFDLQEFAVSHRDKFDIIDLDPFGSPAPYINDVLKLSKDGTMLMITATDTAVLCGAHSAACIKQYGALPLHNELCKEVGLRILIAYFIRRASEFNFGTKPIMSISDMHYMRIFISLEKGAQKAYNSMKQTGFGSHCAECLTYDYSTGIAPKISRTCRECGKNVQFFGPVFLGRLNEKAVLRKIMKNLKEKEAQKTIRMINGEYDIPFFYPLPKIMKKIKTSSIKYESIFMALRAEGYKYSRTQFDKDGIKTDASSKALIKAVKSAMAKQQ